MTKPKPRPKAATRSTARNATKPTSRQRPAETSSKPATRVSTKQARIIAMLRSPAGATIASLATAAEWQQHSVRGFLAGVVRKKLRLNLVSEQTDKGIPANDSRVFRGSVSSFPATCWKRSAGASSTRQLRASHRIRDCLTAQLPRATSSTASTASASASHPAALR
jgi:Protein of unknown function (DUF3489)